MVKILPCCGVVVIDYQHTPLISLGGVHCPIQSQLHLVLAIIAHPLEKKTPDMCSLLDVSIADAVFSV